jgi:hypothetical protein
MYGNGNRLTGAAVAGRALAGYPTAIRDRCRQARVSSACKTPLAPAFRLRGIFVQFAVQLRDPFRHCLLYTLQRSP